MRILDGERKAIKSESDGWYIDDYYFTKEDYEEIFRPFVPRYLQTKLFSEVEQMNEWLKNISKDTVRDIKPSPSSDALCWLVLYEERGTNDIWGRIEKSSDDRLQQQEI